ncbi:MAG: hypothetical protein IKM29_04935, partial [Clostridia bacterium]|nr:hypothetical protein [Clostridia bacterium]
AGESYFDIVVTDYVGTSMSTEAHYAVTWIAFLFVLCSVFFTKLCRADFLRPILCRLRALGVRDSVFLFGKITYPFVFRAVLMVTAVYLLGEMVILSPLSVIGAVSTLLLASVIGTAITLGTDSGVSANAFLSIAGLFLCGGGQL